MSRKWIKELPDKWGKVWKASYKNVDNWKKNDAGSGKRLPKGEVVILLAGLLIAAFFTGMIYTKQEVYAQRKAQEHLAKEVLRFHVLANSDSEQDQALKLQVRDAILNYMEENLPEETTEEVSEEQADQTSDNVSDETANKVTTKRKDKGTESGLERTVQWARTHTDEIRSIGKSVVEAAGSDQPVSVAVTTCYFPDKTYGDVTFPAGNYQALRVELGAAKGHNWWCVLYPSLCFMDTTNAVVPEEGKKQLKEVLTEEEYSRVTANTKFKIGWYFWK